MFLVNSTVRLANCLAAFVAQNSFVASMAARFAIEEGLLGAEDVYSDFDESEMEHVQEEEELEGRHLIPDEVLQRWERRQKRKETEFEVLGDAAKRRRRQELIREKKVNEKAVDALVAVCKHGPRMPVEVFTPVWRCLGADRNDIPFLDEFYVA